MRPEAPAAGVPGGGAEHQPQPDDPLHRVQCQTEGQRRSGLPRAREDRAQVPDRRASLHRAGLQEEGQEEVLPDVEGTKWKRIS